MDLELDNETTAFQTDVRDFLSANAESIPTMSYDNAEGFAQHRHWDRVLFDAGLSVITWPKKYGGRDAPLLHWLVFEEEYFRAGAPGRPAPPRPQARGTAARPPARGTPMLVARGSSLGSSPTESHGGGHVVDAGPVTTSEVGNRPRDSHQAVHSPDAQ